MLFCSDCILRATELEPLETIKLHNVTEFPDQVRLANTRDEKGEYQGAITAEHVSTIYRTGTPHEHSMHCNISLDESAQNTAFEAGKRPLLWGMIKKNYWDYRLRQGFIYPLPYG